MRRFTLPTFLCCCCFAASATAAEVQTFSPVYAAKKREMPEQAATTSTRTAGVQPTSNPFVRSTSTPKKQFTYTTSAGERDSAEILRRYHPNQLARPFAKIDPKIDPKLRRAATIAEERARARTRRRCWRYVKEALLASGAIDSYPKTVNAKEAGDELVRSYGFNRLAIRDPYAAPIGSVLVYYKGRNRPGHVELRTKDGFVSDFRSKTAQPHPLLGVYVKRG